MSEPNNLCRSLIVYGSYGPGGENHGLFAALPGVWKPGKILASVKDEPDNLGPGSADVVEAWLITFSDCQAELFTPEFELQSRLLYERWTSLDLAMGATWGRDSKRWWPKDEQPVVSPAMLVVNIYLPVENYSWLKNRADAPHPDDRDNLPKLWSQLLSGEKKYDSSHFIALIKDAHPSHFEELFGGLPQGSDFISRLTHFFRDHQKSPGSLLADSKEFHLYASPRQWNKLSPEKLLELARADLEQIRRLLESRKDATARSLSDLDFRFVSEAEFRELRQADDEDWTDAHDALEAASDYFIDGSLNETWYWCLLEACYGIAASYSLRNWLMSPWNDCPIDFEPAYLFWKGGGQYGFVGETCYVFSTLE